MLQTLGKHSSPTARSPGSAGTSPRSLTKDLVLTNSSWQSPGLEELGVWLRLAAAHRMVFFFLPASHLAKTNNKKKNPPPPPLNQPTDDGSSKTVVLVTPLSLCTGDFMRLLHSWSQQPQDPRETATTQEPRSKKLVGTKEAGRTTAGGERAHLVQMHSAALMIQPPCTVKKGLKSVPGRKASSSSKFSISPRCKSPKTNPISPQHTG